MIALKTLTYQEIISTQLVKGRAIHPSKSAPSSSSTDAVDGQVEMFCCDG
jgi:hypothetical protein